MDRRDFIKCAGIISATGSLGTKVHLDVDEDLNASHIPRWRGFNLQAKFGPGDKYEESDFAIMAEWGFNFARLPLNYWTWTQRDSWFNISEDALKDIDKAIEFGRQHRVHINLNFHRLPGYCINGRNFEPVDLFSGTEAERAWALSAAIFHWKYFARRYKGIPNRRLSFDLINEPPKMKSEERYVEVVKALVEAIREVEPSRLIFADGIDIGQTPVMGIADLGLVQSTRGYLPKAVSHYTATWVPKDEFESFKPPTWPLIDDLGRTWDRDRLKQELYVKWKPLVDKQVQIHVGEWGCFNKTPHEVTLAWMNDCLSIWKEAGWGFSLWELRGAFGVLDSDRADVKYEVFKGHKLDRKMLELLQSH
jgi:endoglucanase